MLQFSTNIKSTDVLHMSKPDANSEKVVNQYHIENLKIINLVYLGPRATLGTGAWQLMKSKVKSKFGRELSALVFKNTLPKICLDYVKTQCREIPDLGEVVLASPTKLELYL
ncbi:unnamed protein product, partial [Trichogramma brassicae]